MLNEQFQICNQIKCIPTKKDCKTLVFVSLVKCSPSQCLKNASYNLIMLLKNLEVYVFFALPLKLGCVAKFDHCTYLALSFWEYIRNQHGMKLCQAHTCQMGSTRTTGIYALLGSESGHHVCLMMVRVQRVNPVPS